MQGKFRIHATTPVSFVTKKGQGPRVETVNLVLLDETLPVRLVNTIDYQLNHDTDELAKYRDLKVGESVTLGIAGWRAGFQQQGGRFRLEGAILARGDK